MYILRLFGQLSALFMALIVSVSTTSNYFRTAMIPFQEQKDADFIENEEIHTGLSYLILTIIIIPGLALFISKLKNSYSQLEHILPEKENTAPVLPIKDTKNKLFRNSLEPRINSVNEESFVVEKNEEEEEEEIHEYETDKNDISITLSSEIDLENIKIKLIKATKDIKLGNTTDLLKLIGYINAPKNHPIELNDLHNNLNYPINLNTVKADLDNYFNTVNRLSSIRPWYKKLWTMFSNGTYWMGNVGTVFGELYISYNSIAYTLEYLPFLDDYPGVKIGISSFTGILSVIMVVANLLNTARLRHNNEINASLQIDQSTFKLLSLLGILGITYNSGVSAVASVCTDARVINSYMGNISFDKELIALIIKLPALLGLVGVFLSKYNSIYSNMRDHYGANSDIPHIPHLFSSEAPPTSMMIQLLKKMLKFLSVFAKVLTAAISSFILAKNLTTLLSLNNVVSKLFSLFYMMNTIFCVLFSVNATNRTATVAYPEELIKLHNVYLRILKSIHMQLNEAGLINDTQQKFMKDIILAATDMGKEEIDCKKIATQTSYTVGDTLIESAFQNGTTLIKEPLQEHPFSAAIVSPAQVAGTLFAHPHPVAANSQAGLNMGLSVSSQFKY